MLSEEKRQDILLSVDERFGEWLHLRCEKVFNGFESIHKGVFLPAGFDVNSLKNEPPIKILDAILSCCDKLNFTNNQKWSALNAAAASANEIYGIKLIKE